MPQKHDKQHKRRHMKNKRRHMSIMCFYFFPAKNIYTTLYIATLHKQILFLFLFFAELKLNQKQKRKKIKKIV